MFHSKIERLKNQNIASLFQMWKIMKNYEISIKKFFFFSTFLKTIDMFLVKFVEKSIWNMDKFKNKLVKSVLEFFVIIFFISLYSNVLKIMENYGI